MAEANQELFVHAHESYRVSHPVAGGDGSLTLIIEESQLHELAPVDILHRSSGITFRRRRLRIDARAQALVALLRYGLHQKVAKRLEAEVLALTTPMSPQLHCVVDTSGSIGTNGLEQFAGEITAISDEAQPELIRVIYCDAAVQAVELFGPAEPIKLSPKGGGGTDFVPPFRWVEENGIAPKCLIYLTHLCCSSYPTPTDYPVLWVTDSRKSAPFGETVRIGIDH